MNRWTTTDKWIITNVETDEPIIKYNGTFMDVMGFASKCYEDGTIDIESYDNWVSRKENINEQMY